MSQVFPPGANWLVKWSFWAIVFGGITVVGVASGLYWGPPVAVMISLMVAPSRRVRSLSADLDLGKSLFMRARSFGAG